MNATATATDTTFTPADERAIIAAIQYLSGVCDGAQSRDFQGFDGTDSKRGKRLARIAPNWQPYELFWAFTRLAKYRRQLEGAGLQVDGVNAPPAFAYPSWEERMAAGQRVFSQQAPAPFIREIKRLATGYEIRFTFDKDLVADVRLIPGRRYENGVNYAPLSSELAVTEFGLKHGFVWNSFRV